MNRIKVSVITVCLNSVKTIEQTIQSVINQSYKNIEYIIIDGGSTDGTLDIIKKYEAHIAYWASEPDNGIYDAMNKGIKIATGDIIEFLNGDDSFYNENVLVNVIEQYNQYPDTDILVGYDTRCIDTIIHNQDKYTNVYIDAFFPHQATFSQKEVFDRIGYFDVQYRIVADKDWLYRAWSANLRFRLVSDIYVRFGDGGISSGRDSFVEEYLLSEKYLAKTGQEQLIPFAQNRIKKIYGDFQVEKLFSSDDYEGEQSKFWENLLGECKKCIVWGYGKFGSYFVKSLIKCGYEIDLIIDNSLKQNKLGINVKPYDATLIDKKVIIATANFNDEVKNRMMRDGISDKMIVDFNDIRRLSFLYTDKDGKDRNHFYEITNVIYNL